MKPNDNLESLPQEGGNTTQLLYKLKQTMNSKSIEEYKNIEKATATKENL